MATLEISGKADLTKLRRLSLAAQGLTQSAPFGRGLTGARKAIAHVGYVQIDTISVVERAHHHVFRARVPNFTPSMTNRLLKDRSTFEYWAHAAAFIPMHDYRYSLPFKHAIKSGQRHWYRTRDKKLMKELFKRIENEGPLRSRDVEQAKGSGAGWWDWKPAKRALEQLYMQGDLMITSRDGFQKTYDLTEHVLPTEVNTHMPSTEEFATHLLEQQLRCHGLVSLKGITYLRRNANLRAATKTLVSEKVADSTLEQIRTPSGYEFVCLAGTLDTSMPRVVDKVRLLSPFDNAVIQRERLQTIFSFDYQIECYVPAAKRQFGYFCLPILYRDNFIGRVDCKAHRKLKHLELKALHFDTSPNSEFMQHEDRAMTAFATAVEEFAHFQGCQTVALTNVTPKRVAKTLNKLLKKLVDTK